MGILSHAQHAVWFVCDQGTRMTGKVLKLVLGGWGGEVSGKTNETESTILYMRADARCG